MINGGKALMGRLTVPSAKNAALPIIAASLMADGETTVKSCPQLSDIQTSVQIINSIGSRAVMENGGLSITYADSECCEISPDLCGKMRSSILYLAPLLYRKGKAVVYQPGGCNLGSRKIDIHMEGLCRMGARVEYDGDKILLFAPDGLKAVHYRLRLPSVGATQTLIMAACVAKGITVLHNCAREPEVADLAGFLNRAGAKIVGAGKSEVIIRGVDRLCGVEYTPIPDRIFAATVLSAVSACKGICLLNNYPQEYMSGFEKLLKQAGLKIIHYSNSALLVKCIDKACDISVHTGYYPAFSTDMGPLLSSAMVNNNGTLKIYEGVFENRFSYMPQFKKLGLCCYADGKQYYQTQQSNVYSARLSAQDLRAGAAIVVAALAKRGRFTVEGLQYIDRGYQNLEQILALLGADIRRISVEE